MEIHLETLKACFAELPDPRVVERTVHKLEDILFLTLCAVICGMDDWESIEAWGEARIEWLRQFVALENGVPSHDTIARVFAALDSKHFQAGFLRWMSSLCPSLEGQIVAIDGKTARGSHDRRLGKRAIHMVSAFVCGHGITLGQWKTEEKSNEITAIPELIAVLDLKGATVTLDAMGCQKEIARAIVGKGAHYVLGLKGNQGTLSQRVQDHFDKTQWNNYASFANWGERSKESGHGRVDTRRCVALPCDDWKGIEDWPGMKSIVMIESVRQTEKGTEAEKRYYISSMEPDAKKLAHTIRSHWEVENRLHWCLDVTYGEDANRTRKDHAPENLNIIRKITMNILRLSPVKRSTPKKRLRACLHNDYLAEVMGVAT